MKPRNYHQQASCIIGSSSLVGKSNRIDLIGTTKIHEYKQCQSRDCDNEAKHRLIAYKAKKPGWFCSCCVDYFKRYDLIMQIINENSKDVKATLEGYDKETGKNFKDIGLKEHKIYLESEDLPSHDQLVFSSKVIESPLTVYGNNINPSKAFSHITITANHNEFQGFTDLFNKTGSIELSSPVRKDKKNQFSKYWKR